MTSPDPDTPDGTAHTAGAPATVWAAAWIPARSPIADDVDGYGAAWVDLDDGERIQVIVPVAAPEDLPSIGRRGSVRTESGSGAPVFVAEENR